MSACTSRADGQPHNGLEHRVVPSNSADDLRIRASAASGSFLILARSLDTCPLGNRHL